MHKKCIHVEKLYHNESTSVGSRALFVEGRADKPGHEQILDADFQLGGRAHIIIDCIILFVPKLGLEAGSEMY